MKGDFARVTFDPANHYSQVFQQQGRVLLEADWNEQGRIQQYLLRSFITDLVGPCWAAGTGFKVTVATDANNTRKPVGTWALSQGHFYVDGILCELDQDCTLATQPNLPTPDDGSNGFANPAPQSPYWLWLDVWERHLSYVEAPKIADIALDGVDTASRLQTVWQLRLLSQAAAQALLKDVQSAMATRQSAQNSAPADAAALKQPLPTASLQDQLSSAAPMASAELCAFIRRILGARISYACPQLAAELKAGSADADPCSIVADARYSGGENQLYRVEIHGKGLPGNGASFKWSRENGSAIFPIVSTSNPSATDATTTSMTVTVANLGRDDRLGLAVGDWVELVDDLYTLGQQSGPLLQVSAIQIAGCVITLQIAKGLPPYGVTLGEHPYLRRWDQKSGVSADGTLAVKEGPDGTVELENGIKVTFQPGGLYATGDYWLIPARVANGGSLDWPVAQSDGSPIPVNASGLHHFAVLGGYNDNDAAGYTECCCRFGSLCTVLPQLLTPPTGGLSNAPVVVGKPAPSGRSTKAPGT